MKWSGNLCKLFYNISLNNRVVFTNVNNARQFSSSSSRFDLMEFFDDKKNWGAQEVKTGRSWSKDELRIKSNTDLHKLWYVLLKERNMLLTMEEYGKQELKLFPSPERIDKVEDSMENLEAVVRERNKAYHLLETGETGERPKRMERSALGLNYCYKMSEYPIPKHMNTKWRKTHLFYKPGDKDVETFLGKYNEKIYLENRRKNTREFRHVVGLLRRFPNMNMQALQEQYPGVDIEKAKRHPKAKGHSLPT